MGSNLIVPPATDASEGPLAAYDPLAKRVLKPDLDFWRARKSAAEPRSITVKVHTSMTCGTPEVRRALLQMWQTLDWMALRRIVDASR